MKSIIKITLISFLLISNWTALSAQATIILNRSEYTKDVLSFEKTAKNLKEVQGKLVELQLIIDAQGVRLAEMPKDFDIALLKVKTAYDDLVKKSKRQRFWAWVKGLPVGAAIMVVILLL